MITKKQKTEARDFLKQFGLKCRFTKTISEVDCWEGIIRLETNIPHNAFISTMFHELSHIICVVEGKWLNFHLDLCDNEYMRRNALRIERYVDKRAEEIMKLYYPELEFDKAYRSKEDITWFRKWLDREYPKEE